MRCAHFRRAAAALLASAPMGVRCTPRVLATVGHRAYHDAFQQQQGSRFQGNPPAADRPDARGSSPGPSPSTEGPITSSPAPPPPSSSSSSSSRPVPVIKIHNGRGESVSVQPIKHFADVAEDLPPWLVRGIRENGYNAPTPVQSVSIPLLMEDRDVIGVAPTGSGKTVAFAIPALSTITPRGFTNEGVARPKVLVLCPTRELVQQTSKVMLQLGGGVVKVSHAFGGQDREVQANFLSKGCDVLVAAPGRLCDFIESGVVKLDAIDFLVFDEADRMLEMGFARQISFIMGSIDPKRKRTTMMWTATWHPKVQALSADYLSSDPLRIVVGAAKDGINLDIEQRVAVVDHEGARIGAVAALYDSGVVSSGQQVIVFAKTQESTEWVAEELTQNLRHHGLSANTVQCIHGRMRQNKRAAIVDAFRDGRIKVLVATDVAARGLDFPSVDHVVNYDLPNDIDAYVHRIGRTGRAGRKGKAHTVIPRGSKSPFLSDLTNYFEKNNIAVSDDFHDVARRTIGIFDPRAKRSKYLRPGEASGLGADWKAPAPRGGRGGGGGGGGAWDAPGGPDFGGGRPHHRGPISVKRPQPRNPVGSGM